MIADNLFEWDRTSFATGAKNWLTRQGDEWLGTPDAMARHNVRLAANKIYAAWRMYVVQTPANPPLQGTNVDLANFITRYYGADKIAPLNNLVPDLLPPTPPAAQQTATPGTTEGRRRTGRLVEADPAQTVPPIQPQAQPQAQTQAPPAQAPAQAPAQPAAVVLNRAQVDQLFVALARIMLDSGEAQPGMKQRPQKGGDYREGGGNQGSGGGGAAGRSLEKLMNVTISSAGLKKGIERAFRDGIQYNQTQADNIRQIIAQSPSSIGDIMKTPLGKNVSGNTMLMLMAAAEAS